METTKEKLMEEAAQHKVETMDKKVDVAKAEVTEKVDSVKIGAADLAEKAEDKWEETKEKAKGMRGASALLGAADTVVEINIIDKISRGVNSSTVRRTFLAIRRRRFP